jgi:hypothetical protein
MWLLVSYNVRRNLEGYEAFAVIRASDTTLAAKKQGRTIVVCSGVGMEEVMTTPNKRMRVSTTALLLYLLVSGPIAAAQSTGEQLLEAARRAIESGDPTEFTTVLNGAAVLALGFVNVRIKDLRNRIATALAEGTINREKAAEMLETLANIQSRLAEAKNGRLERHHRDQGHEPFFGTFMSDVPIVPPVSPKITLTLQPDSSISFIVRPDIWGRGIVKPKVINARLDVEIGEGKFSVTNSDEEFDSFDINGTPSGPNRVLMLPGTNGSFQFDPQTGSFEARYSGLLVNDLYPAENPIHFFSDVAGFVLPEQPQQIFVSTETEPMIVPGIPGEPPVDNLGMAYIPTRAMFDPLTSQLTFSDSVSTESTPSVSIVRTPDGRYIFEIGALEPLIGAKFRIDPLIFLRRDDGTGAYLFANSHFSIVNSKNVASGQLTNIKIDLRWPPGPRQTVKTQLAVRWKSLDRQILS